MSGIVKNNTASAEGSHDNANEVESITHDALNTAKELVLAMEAVLKSNSDIQSLIKIINGIAEKVNIIDDIVFQTKLLSFNASVEAERAGEHGRGFAVVSQEIANLAQVSGKSAAEISLILKESTSKVQEIVKNNTQHVERGNLQVEKTRDILEKIETYAKKVKESTLQVMQSSTEQNTGISQISKSMAQLDEATQSNAATSEEAASSSEELSAQVESLNNAIRDLYFLVMGKKFVEGSNLVLKKEL